jgi:hypothetical protein
MTFPARILVNLAAPAFFFASLPANATAAENTRPGRKASADSRKTPVATRDTKESNEDVRADSPSSGLSTSKLQPTAPMDSRARGLTTEDEWRRTFPTKLR